MVIERHGQENKLEFYLWITRLSGLSGMTTGRRIRKSNFSSVITDQLKSYGILMKPYLSSSSGEKNQIILDYSISIPGSEIGTGVSLIINKKGDYKVAKN